MTIPSYNPHHTSSQSSIQSPQPPALERASGKSRQNITAHVTPISNDVFSSARQSGPPCLHGVSPGASSASQSESTVSHDMLDGGTVVPEQIIKLYGKIHALDVYPAERDKIMKGLDIAIETTRTALEQVDRHWNSQTLAVMKTLLGPDVKSDNVRAAIKSRLEKVISGLENLRANKGKDIFIQEPGKPDGSAYTLSTPSGYTGQIVFSKAALGQVDDTYVQKTLIHETLHLTAHLDDHWYISIEGNGIIRRTPHSSSTNGSMPPVTSNVALDNADSVAYATLILALNKRSNHQEL